jgi:hypothetical protein
MKKKDKHLTELTKNNIEAIAQSCIDISLKIKSVLESIKVSDLSRLKIESKFKESNIVYFSYADSPNDITVKSPHKWFDIFIYTDDGNWKKYNYVLSGIMDFRGANIMFDRQKNSLRTFFLDDKSQTNKLKFKNGKYGKVFYEVFCKFGIIKDKSLDFTRKS